MRFHFGPVPEDPSFSPEAEGWSRLREPGPWAMQLIATPVAIGAIVFSGVLIFLAYPRELLRNPQALGGPAWLWVTILALLIPVHEGVHAVLHPDGGLSERSVIGLWLSKAVFYAHYEGAMSRNRRLLALAGPYLVLSLLPVGLMALPGAGAWPPVVVAGLAFLSIVGGVVACGDAVGFALLAFQVPPGAMVRNQGWQTYWKNTPLHRPGAGQVGEG